jgi:hypothetical protein
MVRPVAEIVESRLLNRDAAGMIVERLDQKRIGELVDWFAAKDGGAEGATIVLRAPLVDTIIQRNVEIACRPRPDFRVMAMVLFGSGLGIAAGCLAERESETAFPIDADLHMMLGMLEEFEFPKPIAPTDDSVAGEFDPVAVTRRLCELDGRIDVLVQAMFRIAMQLHGLAGRRETAPAALIGSAWSRLIFVAGMVAAGIAIPALPAPKPEAAQSGNRKTRSRRT